MQHKSVIFVVISILIIALIYSSFTPFIVFAEPPASGWSQSKNCEQLPGGKVKCCWTEREPGPGLVRLRVDYCQTCHSVMSNPECTPKEKQSVTPPTTGEDIVPGDTGVLEQPPTTPQFDPTAPLQGGVLEQLQNDQPPLFGWNIPQGGFEVLQGPETPPMFGQVAPLIGGNAPLGFFGQESAEVTTPMPTPTPTPSPIPTPDDGSSPLTGQNAQPGGGVLQEPEDDGQEDSPEGAETAGPLT